MTLRELVARERFRLVATMGARGAAFSLAAAAVLAALAAFWLGDARWITEPAAPAIAWIIVASAIGVPLVWTIARVRRAASPAKVAHAIEQERALRDGSLRGALEVEDQGAFGKRAAGALGASLATHRGALAPAMLRGAVITGAGAVVSAMLALVLLGGARRNAPDGWRAMRHPVGAWTGALIPPLRIVDPPREVMRGDSLRLRILAPSRRAIAFHTRATGAPWSERMLEVTDGATSVTLGPLDADIALVASDGRTQTDTVTVRVTDRPFVGDVAIRAIYPAYLGRAAEPVPAGETVRVPRGTTLRDSRPRVRRARCRGARERARHDSSQARWAQLRGSVERLERRTVDVDRARPARSRSGCPGAARRRRHSGFGAARRDSRPGARHDDARGKRACAARLRHR